MDADASAYRQRFHSRWEGLRDPHERALAWLLDAPDLLDPNAIRWQGKIARLPEGASDDARDWLMTLDAEPDSLRVTLDLNLFRGWVGMQKNYWRRISHTRNVWSRMACKFARARKRLLASLIFCSLMV